jgi:hypothetical protein
MMHQSEEEFGHLRPGGKRSQKEINDEFYQHSAKKRFIEMVEKYGWHYDWYGSGVIELDKVN